MVVQLLSLPFGVTLFLWFTRTSEVTFAETLLAAGLIYIPWHSYLQWVQRGEERIPVFAMVSFVYWVYYGLPLFWGDRIISDIYSPTGRELAESSILKAEIMAILGVLCMWVGFKFNPLRIVRVPRITLPLSGFRWNYLRALLIFGTLISLREPNFSFLGEGSRQMLSLFIVGIPTVVFAIFFGQFVRKKLLFLDKLLIMGFLIIRLIVGLSSGMLGAFGAVLIISAAVFMAEQKRIPRVALISVVAFVLFFQPAKSEFRNVYWTENKVAPMSDRISFWVERSLVKWGDAISDQTGRSRTELLNESLSRVSLLTPSANVIDQTPLVVPYQYGRLYSYLLVTFIPRVVWPDKPSSSEANQFYQIAYSISDEEQLKTVSVSIGILVEGYINFGWPGALGIMFALGIIIRFYQTGFFGRESGALLGAIGVVLLPGFLSIENQFAGYVGGLIQKVVFIIVVMLPVIRMRSHSLPVGLPATA